VTGQFDISMNSQRFVWILDVYANVALQQQLQESTRIVNSRFLQHPKKQSHHRNQLIHRRLSKTKSIGNGSDPESQAGRQSDGYGGWCLELKWPDGREVGRRG